MILPGSIVIVKQGAILCSLDGEMHSRTQKDDIALVIQDLTLDLIESVHNNLSKVFLVLGGRNSKLWTVKAEWLTIRGN